jgi:hypothetical protein
VLLRCTGKVLKLLRESPAASESSGEEWYANLLWIEGRKCLLLTHVRTLFSVFIRNVAVSQLRAIGPFVVSSIQTALAAEGQRLDTFGDLGTETVSVAKTADRHIIGTMNDQAFTACHVIANAGGLAHCEAEDINRVLHRTINGVTGYARSIELVTAPRGGDW